MSVATNSNKVNLVGNGAATVWPFPFIIPALSQMVVQFMDSLGNVTTLASSAFSTSNLNVPGGGSITYPINSGLTPTGNATVQANESITIQRVVPYTQPTSLANQSNFYASAVEAAMDNIEYQLQQQNSIIGSSIAAPAVDVAPAMMLPSALKRANMYLAFDAAGNPKVVNPASGLILASSQVQFSVADAGAFGDTVSAWIRRKGLDVTSFHNTDGTQVGAVPGVQDDTTGFQAWLNALGARGTGAVGYIPTLPGSFYNITGKLNLPIVAGLTITGDSRWSTEVRLTPTVVGTDLFSSNNNAAGAVNGMRIFNLAVTAGNTNARRGISWIGCNRSVLYVRAFNFSGVGSKGVYIQDSLQVDGDIYAHYCYDGVYADTSATYPLNASRLRLQIEVNSHLGCYIADHDSLLIDLLLSQSNGQGVSGTDSGGIDVRKGKNLKVMGAYLGEANRNFDLRLGMDGETDLPYVEGNVYPSLSIAATGLLNGDGCQIVAAGTTDYTLIGAANNNVGTKFTATGPGAGTGTCIRIHYPIHLAGVVNGFSHRCMLGNGTAFINFVAGQTVQNSKFGTLPFATGVAGADPTDTAWAATYQGLGLDPGFLSRNNFIEDYTTFPYDGVNLCTGDMPLGEFAFGGGAATWTRSPNTGTVPDAMGGRPVGLLNVTVNVNSQLSAAWTVTPQGLNGNYSNKRVTFAVDVLVDDGLNIRQWNMYIDDNAGGYAKTVTYQAQASQGWNTYYVTTDYAVISGLRCQLNGFSAAGVYKFANPRVFVGMDPRQCPKHQAAPNFMASAAPATGTWARADVVLNNAPAASGAPGWVCTTAGTGGGALVFKAMGNLAA